MIKKLQNQLCRSLIDQCSERSQKGDVTPNLQAVRKVCCRVTRNPFMRWKMNESSLQLSLPRFASTVF